MKNVVCCLACLSVLIGIAAPAIGQPSAFGTAAPAPKTEEKAAGEGKPEEAPKTPEAVFEKMELKERIAQLMIVTLQGETAPSGEDVSFMKSYLPGGVVVRQAIDADSAMGYVRLIREFELNAKAPLLIGADLYELARRDRRAASLYAQLPSLLSVAATRDAACAGQLGGALADLCRSIGFDFHLGPSLELAPSIAEAPGTLNTLGSDPVFAAAAGQAIFQAFADRGVMAVPMGFPGGGNNRSEGTPAVLLTPAPRLAECDLMPYAKVIEGGTKLIHVGNTLMPTLDARSRPASQSKAVITDLLRVKLHFDGLAVAGPIDSEDVVKHADASEAALQALEAGADLLYWNGAESTVMRAVDHLLQLVKTGRLNEAIINEAAKRVLKFKFELREATKDTVKNRQWASALEKRAMNKEAYHIERRAITMAKNDGQVLPLDKHSGMVGVVGTIEVEAFRDALQKYVPRIPEFRIVTAQSVGDIEDFEIERITKNYGAVKTMVCVYTEAPRVTGQVRLLSALKKAGMRVVLVRLGYPAQLDELAEADAIVLAYCDSVTYGETLRAVADVLGGAGPIRIDLPAKEIVFTAGESRRFAAAEVVRTPTGYLPVQVSEAFPVGLGLNYDPGKAIKKATWEFGDKKKSKGMSVEHAYGTPGLYAAKLSVKGQKKESASREFRITVEQ